MCVCIYKGSEMKRPETNFQLFVLAIRLRGAVLTLVYKKVLNLRSLKDKSVGEVSLDTNLICL